MSEEIIIPVYLCSGTRVGLEVLDNNEPGSDNNEPGSNVIVIKLVPEWMNNPTITITVSLVSTNWELNQADEMAPELSHSNVDYFLDLGTYRYIQTDWGDGYYWGLTKVDLTMPDQCDFSKVTVKGSLSGDLISWNKPIVNDGLISDGNAVDTWDIELYTDPIPGEVLRATYEFYFSNAMTSSAVGYNTNGLTHGIVKQVKWHVVGVVRIYLIEYEGREGWFFNSQCVELSVGQIVFLNTALVESNDISGDADISYGAVLDNAYIVPMKIKGYGFSGIVYDASKIYNNVRYAQGYINHINRVNKTAFITIPALWLDGDAEFYCLQDGIDPTSGDQFLDGDGVLVMISGASSIFTGNWKIIGRIPFTTGEFPLFIAAFSQEYYANGVSAYTGFYNRWISSGFSYINDNTSESIQNFLAHTKYGTVRQVTTDFGGMYLKFIGEYGLGIIRVGSYYPVTTATLEYNNKSFDLDTNGLAFVPYHPGFISWGISIHTQIAVNFAANKFAILFYSKEYVDEGPEYSHNIFYTYAMEFTFDGQSVSGRIVDTKRYVEKEHTWTDNGRNYRVGSAIGSSISSLYYDKNDTLDQVYTTIDGTYNSDYGNIGGYTYGNFTRLHYGILSYPIDSSYGWEREYPESEFAWPSPAASYWWGSYIDANVNLISKSCYLSRTFHNTAITVFSMYIDDELYADNVGIPFVYDNTRICYNRKKDAIYAWVYDSNPHAVIKYKGEIIIVPNASNTSTTIPINL